MSERLKVIHFWDEGHRVLPDVSSSTSKSLVARKDFQNREIVIEQDEFDTRIYRETEAGSGRYEYMHKLPNSSIRQAEPFDSSRQPDCMPRVVAEKPAVNVLKGSK